MKTTEAHTKLVAMQHKQKLFFAFKHIVKFAFVIFIVSYRYEH